MSRGRSEWTIKVNEGDIYAVPLRDGGYGRVVVSRVGKRGITFGYFFGPHDRDLPPIESSHELKADEAEFCQCFGDRGIQTKSWPLLGRIERWERTQWPLPSFGRIANEALGMAWIDTYSGDDLNKPPIQRRCTPEEARRYPPEGLLGDGAASILLTKMLKGEKVPW